MADPIYVGRAGLPTASGGDGLTLYTDSWEQEGDEATVGLQIRQQSSVAAVKALRDQLLGYGPHNTDEPVIPVVNTADSSRDGFYRVTSIVQDNELTGRLGASNEAGGNLAYDLTAELQRVPSWQQPLIEVVCSGADRANDHTVSDGSSWAAIPLDTDTIAVTGTTPTVSSQGVGASTYMIHHATAMYDNTVLYRIDTDEYYKYACWVQESTDDGATWYTVTGRHMAKPSATTHWRICSGDIRVYPTTSGVTNSFDVAINGAFTTPDFDAKTYKLTRDSSATDLGNPRSVTILRNSPECCSVRVGFDLDAAAATAPISTYADFTVRRGSWLAEVYISNYSTGATNRQFGVFRTSVEAGTDITGGLEATSDDADGHKYRLYSASTIVTDNVNGGIYLNTAADSGHFGISSDRTTYDTGNFTSHDLYFAAMNHRQSVTSR